MHVRTIINWTHPCVVECEVSILIPIFFSEWWNGKNSFKSGHKTVFGANKVILVHLNWVDQYGSPFLEMVTITRVRISSGTPLYVSDNSKKRSPSPLWNTHVSLLRTSILKTFMFSFKNTSHSNILSKDTFPICSTFNRTMIRGALHSCTPHTE